MTDRAVSLTGSSGSFFFFLFGSFFLVLMEQQSRPSPSMEPAHFKMDNRVVSGPPVFANRPTRGGSSARTCASATVKYSGGKHVFGMCTVRFQIALLSVGVGVGGWGWGYQTTGSPARRQCGSDGWSMEASSDG